MDQPPVKRIRTRRTSFVNSPGHTTGPFSSAYAQMAGPGPDTSLVTSTSTSTSTLTSVPENTNFGPFSYGFSSPVPTTKRPREESPFSAKPKQSERSTQTSTSKASRSGKVDRSIARRRVGKFMHTYRKKITATYLAHVCTDANECMAFGHDEYQRIRSFFDFTSFAHTTEPVKMLPPRSMNGQIAIIRYVREKYTAAALFKLAMKEGADSPYYEFTVGRFVNEYLINAFPCFTETYGLFELQQGTYDTLMKDKQKVDFGTTTPPLFCDSSTPLSQLTSDKDLIRRSCEAGLRLGILSQFFDNAWSLYDLNTKHPKVAAQDGLSLLFQVYGPLSVLDGYFTHYDLHDKNVLVVPTPSGTCIHMHYHLSGGEVVSFKTKYIAKIIDYGRCFFRAKGEGESSADLSKVLCGSDAPCRIKRERESETPVKSHCGSRSGFWLDPEDPTAYQITPRKKNASIDLICAYDYLKSARLRDTTGQLDAIFTQLPAILGTAPFKSKEMTSQGNQINTVTKLAGVLATNIYNPAWTKYNEWWYRNLPVHGHLHVYMTNRPGLQITPMKWTTGKN